MPENWKTYKLGEVANLSTGFAFKSKDYRNSGDLKVIRGKNITEGYLRWGDDSRYWNFSMEKLDKYVVEEGDIVVGMDGSKIGKNRAIVRSQDLPSILAQRVGRINAKPKIAEQKFLWQLINNKIFEDYIDNVKTGTSIPHISLTQIGNLEILLPSLPEQKSIASILSALDDKIELNLQMNKTLEEMAMALYKHWFVDFGPFQDGEFVESEMGEMPKGWEVKLLNELGNIFYGKMPKKDKLQKEGFPVFSGYRNVGFYPIYNCNKGKIIVVARGVGGTGDVKMTNEKCFLTNLSICISNEFGHIDDNLLFFGLKRNGLDYLRTGSAQPQITINDLNRVSALIPPKQTQADFLHFFKPLLLQMDYNQQENQTLTQLRNTLLPKLISGEVRVKDVEKTLTEVL